MRLLYGWPVDERMTIRQILKRLNFGPCYPRSGRHPWSPSVVHHILSKPVYTGTAYANRYDLDEAKKARSRKPNYTGKGCRRIPPREQWIAIPVPAVIEQGLWDRAQAQLARNAKRSSRNNQKHNHLLRCLLTCSTCGLAMHGVARALAGWMARNYYRCAGKDRLMTARESACPRAHLDAGRREITPAGARRIGSEGDPVEIVVGAPPRRPAEGPITAESPPGGPYSGASTRPPATTTCGASSSSFPGRNRRQSSPTLPAGNRVRR